MTRNRTIRGLVATVGMALAALFWTVTPASAATGPYGFTILHADAGNGAHTCHILGYGFDKNGNSAEAIICVDIDTGGGSYGYQATGAIETYCQLSNGADTQCPFILVEGFFSNASSGPAYSSWSCVTSSCSSSGRNYLYVHTTDYSSASCTTNSANNVWSTAEGNTEIQLYNSGGGLETFYVSDHAANDGNDYSTGHYWICP